MSRDEPLGWVRRRRDEIREKDGRKVTVMSRNEAEVSRDEP